MSMRAAWLAFLAITLGLGTAFTGALAADPSVNATEEATGRAGVIQGGVAITTGLTPVLGVDPESLDFGRICLNEQSDLVVELFNANEDPTSQVDRVGARHPGPELLAREPAGDAVHPRWRQPRPAHPGHRAFCADRAGTGYGELRHHLGRRQLADQRCARGRRKQPSPVRQRRAVHRNRRPAGQLRWLRLERSRRRCAHLQLGLRGWLDGNRRHSDPHLCDERHLHRHVVGERRLRLFPVRDHGHDLRRAQRPTDLRRQWPVLGHGRDSRSASTAPARAIPTARSTPTPGTSATARPAPARTRPTPT